MRLLKFKFDHLRMFEGGVFSLDFIAEDRVPASDESVHKLKDSIHANNLIAFAGINASGKTMSLALTEFALRIVSGYSVNDSDEVSYYADLFDERASFNALVQYPTGFYIVETDFKVNNAKVSYIITNKRFLVEEERIYTLPGNLSKKALTADFEELKQKASGLDVRSNAELSLKRALGDERSMAILLNENIPLAVRLSAHDGDFSLPEDTSDIDEILRVFDASIESIRRDRESKTIELAVKGRPDSLILTPSEVELVLSSGTKKGFKLATIILEILKGPNYLLIDEIENHLNKLLVQTIIGLFSDSETNPHGATLIFTTHYPEILDCIHRKDNVYFLVRTPEGKISEAKYSDHVSRIENKKSEVFISNYIKGTAPKFTDVDAFKKLAKRSAVLSLAEDERWGRR